MPVHDYCQTLLMQKFSAPKTALWKDFLYARVHHYFENEKIKVDYAFSHYF